MSNPQRNQKTAVQEHGPLAMLHHSRKAAQEVQTKLEANGYHVKLFRSGGRLLSWLDGHPAELVLLDLAEFEQSARTILRIRERFPLVPIIALANGCDAAMLARAMDNGANHFILETENEDVLRGTVDRLVNFRMEHIRYVQVLPYLHTRFQATIPSDIELLGGMVFYLVEEMFKHGIISLNQINVKVALIEAMTNAMEHGNKFDPKKMVSVEAEFDYEKATIDITDEGPGFDVDALPNPTHESNIFRPRGRGVYMMRQFLDDVTYHAPGNHVTLVKKRTSEQAIPRPYPWERRSL